MDMCMSSLLPHCKNHSSLILIQCYCQDHQQGIHQVTCFCGHARCSNCEVETFKTWKPQKLIRPNISRAGRGFEAELISQDAMLVAYSNHRLFYILSLELSMDLSRSDSLFKQHAFIWSPSFSTRKEKRYLNENQSIEAERLRLLRESGTIDTQRSDHGRIFSSFLEMGCESDVERYSYWNIQLEEFVGPIEMRRLEVSDTPNDRLVLVDDRNNSTASPINRGGASRPSEGPLTASKFYELLQKPVCIQSYEQARDWLHPLRLCFLISHQNPKWR